MEKFSLYQLIVGVLDETTLVEPDDVAAEVARRIPPEDAKEAFRQALRAYASKIMALTRSGREVPVRSARSAKVSGIREAWLNQRWRGDDGQWKLMRHFTYADCIAAAEYRKEEAAKNLAIAGRLERLADTLKEYDAQEVGQLPARIRDQFGD
jgi:hypothetical protein